MAIDPSDVYSPTQIDTSDPTGYPLGAARNDTIPGDNTGTPLSKEWVNDLWGFFQAILARAGATPSGTPEKVGASQYLDALTTLVVEHTATAAAQAWPDGYTHVEVEGVAAGGGGGAGGASVGGGGGGSGYPTGKRKFKISDLGADYSVTLGSAGTGGTAGANGGDGGTFSFTSGAVTLTADGGSGGLSEANGGAGGDGFSGGGARRNSTSADGGDAGGSGENGGGGTAGVGELASEPRRIGCNGGQGGGSAGGGGGGGGALAGGVGGSNGTGTAAGTGGAGRGGGGGGGGRSSGNGGAGAGAYARLTFSIER